MTDRADVEKFLQVAIIQPVWDDGTMHHKVPPHIAVPNIGVVVGKATQAAYLAATIAGVDVVAISVTVKPFLDCTDEDKEQARLSAFMCRDIIRRDEESGMVAKATAVIAQLRGETGND